MTTNMTKRKNVISSLDQKRSQREKEINGAELKTAIRTNVLMVLDDDGPVDIPSIAYAVMADLPGIIKQYGKGLEARGVQSVIEAALAGSPKVTSSVTRALCNFVKTPKTTEQIVAGLSKEITDLVGAGSLRSYGLAALVKEILDEPAPDTSGLGLSFNLGLPFRQGGKTVYIRTSKATFDHLMAHRDMLSHKFLKAEAELSGMTAGAASRLGPDDCEQDPEAAFERDLGAVDWTAVLNYHADRDPAEVLAEYDQAVAEDEAEADANRWETKKKALEPTGIQELKHKSSDNED